MEKDYMRELVKKVAEIVEDFMTKTKYWNGRGFKDQPNRAAARRTKPSQKAKRPRNHNRIALYAKTAKRRLKCTCCCHSLAIAHKYNNNNNDDLYKAVVEQIAGRTHCHRTLERDYNAVRGICSYCAPHLSLFTPTFVAIGAAFICRCMRLCVSVARCPRCWPRHKRS